MRTINRTLYCVSLALPTAALIILSYRYQSNVEALQQEKQRFQAYREYHQVYVHANHEEKQKMRAENAALKAALEAARQKGPINRSASDALLRQPAPRE